MEYTHQLNEKGKAKGKGNENGKGKKYKVWTLEESNKLLQ